MTNTEALKRLKEPYNDNPRTYHEAINTAINALSNQVICPSHNVDCTDCPAHTPIRDVVDVIKDLRNGIVATNANDEYSCGMRNGIRWAISVLNDEKPMFEDCPNRVDKVLEDIKAEITELKDSWELDCYHDEADALNTALEIIDKHISGKESK